MNLFGKKPSVNANQQQEQEQETMPMVETNETVEKGDYDHVTKALTGAEEEYKIFNMRAEALKDALRVGDSKKVKAALGKVKRASQDYRISLKEINALTL